MPLQQTSGNVTADAYGGGVAAIPNYIEDVFSTYLYTTNNSTQTITNGINLSVYGGLMWFKPRNNASNGHSFVDSNRGNYAIYSNRTDAQDALVVGGGGAGSIALNTNGFSFSGSIYDSYGNINNGTTTDMVSWTFRKQPKFFDVVTYTGNSTAGRTIAHNLGSTPGCIIVKQTGGGGSGGVNNWFVYHQSLGATQAIILESTGAAFTSSSPWNNTAPTSTVFSVGGTSDCNGSGGTYVAYLFAHNAGGFGLTGTDNVISCGSFTCDGSGNATINLGYEPQWVLMKASSTTANWQLSDTMRGMSQSQINQLVPNTSSAEGSVSGNYMFPTATGFQLANGWGSASQTFIYIAIRRGPMKVPTDATTVFSLNARSGTGANATVTGGQVDDLVVLKRRNGANAPTFADRLRGSAYLLSSATSAENTDTAVFQSNAWDIQNGVKVGTGGPATTTSNSSSGTYINYLFQRAPSFFDEVCYTGTGSSGQVINHNLGVTPEMVIIKRRDGTFNWFVYQTGLSYGNSIYLNTTAAQSNDGGPAFTLTSTTITFDRTYVSNLNTSGGTYVAYLFATCAGVSKVGSYTGNGTTQTINCGFTGGARFVLIKRTDSTGDWYVYDTARGMTTLTDPYLLLNSTSAESATLGSVTTATTGFAVNASILAAINTNGASYIFLAIA